MLYDHIKSPRSGLLTKPDGDGIYHVLFSSLMDEERFVDLNLEDWKVLIHKLYFDGDDFTSIAIDFDDDTELSVELSKIFDYDNPLSFKGMFNPVPSTPPRGEGAASTPTPFLPGQGDENSCFAHAAANMILHNVYKLRLTKPEASKFIESDCNKYLDTSNTLADYAEIEAACGVIGVKRILLFHYIYRVITKEFGTNRGVLRDATLYYLQQPFDETIFSPELSAIIRDEFEDGKKRNYTLSAIPIDEFDINEYGPYFEEYYASIHVMKPAHFFTIVGINPTIKGKDSSTGKSFTIRTRDFKSEGRITIDDSKWDNISYIFFLFETSKADSYPDIVKESVETKVFPKALGAALEAAAEGGKKSRKRRKTRRKRSRRRKN